MTATLRITGFSRPSLGNVPPDSRPFAKQFRLPADFGTLSGASRGRHFVWFEFYVDRKEQPVEGLWPIPGSGELLQGTIELPPMTIDGVRYEEQVLSFEHASYFDFFNPVNC